MLRRVSEAVLFAVLGVIVVRAWLLEGVVVPIRIVGPSMAETLLGPHFDVVCGDCGFEFACDATTARRLAAAACPNCGFEKNDVTGAAVQAGDRLLLDKLTFSLRQPRRWELILFRCPATTHGYCIKRVVGLPGEAIQICAGDVMVNGRRAQKSLPELRQLAPAVHDSRFAPTDVSLPDRWQPESAASGWQATASGFRFTPHQKDIGTGDVPDVDWLWYHHWRGRSRVDGGVEEGPVSDNYGYNQTISRRLNNVRDLMLRATIETTGDGTLSFLATGGGAEFVLHVEPQAGSGTLYRWGRPVDRFELGHGILANGSDVELALVDLRVLLAVDGRQLLAYRYGESEGAPSAGGSASDRPPPRADALQLRRDVKQPFAIGASGLSVRLENLMVRRDVFYTGDPVTGGCRPPEPLVLGDDELFVVGDNSPVSLDSRQGGPDTVVKLDSLLGRPRKYP